MRLRCGMILMRQACELRRAMRRIRSTRRLLALAAVYDGRRAPRRQYTASVTFADRA